MPCSDGRVRGPIGDGALQCAYFVVLRGGRYRGGLIAPYRFVSQAHGLSVASARSAYALTLRALGYANVTIKVRDGRIACYTQRRERTRAHLHTQTRSPRRAAAARTRGRGQIPIRKDVYMSQTEQALYDRDRWKLECARTSAACCGDRARLAPPPLRLPPSTDPAAVTACRSARADAHHERAAAAPPPPACGLLHVAGRTSLWCMPRALARSATLCARSVQLRAVARPERDVRRRVAVGQVQARQLHARRGALCVHRARARRAQLHG